MRKAKSPAAPSDLAALEQTLGHTFKERTLLERALSHRSWAHEQVGPGEEEKARRLHNEALEFMGDSVLGMVVADYLFNSHPEVTEGELSRMKHRLVSTQTLARAARRLGIGDFLRVGRGEEKTGGRRKRALLADSFEALLAAIYIDGGLDAATEFVHHALGDELTTATPDNAAAADYKTLLQEVLQAEQRTTPHYDVIETQGPPHQRMFHVEVSWEGAAVRGEGRTIKAAEIEAARRALAQMKDGHGAPKSSGEAKQREAEQRDER